jgi:UDP-N-acetylglucosamine 2-epimerase
MKIVTIVGARPQFIKAAAVKRAIKKWNKGKKRIEEILVHTGQHYDILMDKVFFEELNLPKPDYHLGIGSGSHAKQTGLMLERIEAVLQIERPKVVMVYGDTNSTLAGALAAAKLNIPVAHVEAGLRSYDQTMPEEINRLLTDHLSAFLFCPTDQAVRNLSKEGIEIGKTRRVKNVGDVMYDSILYYSKIAEKKSTILHDLHLANPQSPIRYAPRRVHGSSVPRRIQGQSPEPHMVQGAFRIPNYYLATLHRAENTDDPKRLRSILKALDEIGREIPVILPLHPRTKKMMNGYHLFSKFKNVRFIEPVSYLNMLKLEKNAKAILTDSGGVQKEAYWFRTPCVTLREVTEWGYTTEEGWNTLSGWRTRDILQATQKISALKKKRKKNFRERRGAGEAMVRVLSQSGF